MPSTSFSSVTVATPAGNPWRVWRRGLCAAVDLANGSTSNLESVHTRGGVAEQRRWAYFLELEDCPQNRWNMGGWSHKLMLTSNTPAVTAATPI